MPFVTFAGDAGTDVLTAVGHGLTTGDGPGLGSGCGLDDSADYWVIRLDADTPKSVDVAGSQVKSADLNALQDAAKGLVTKVHSKTFPSSQNGTATGGTVIGSGVVQLAAGGGTVYDCALPMPVGARLRKVTIDGSGNAADDVTVSVSKARRTTGTALASPTVWSNVPAANGSLVIDIDENAADSRFALGEMLTFSFGATSGANVVLYGITLEWDFLPADWD